MLDVFHVAGTIHRDVLDAYRPRIERLFRREQRCVSLTHASKSSLVVSNNDAVSGQSGLLE
jgi:hypothetical protein